MARWDFSSSQSWTWKRIRKDVTSTQESSDFLFFSFLSLLSPLHWLPSSYFENWGDTQHTRRNTHRRQKGSHKNKKESNKVLKKKRIFSTHTGIHIGIYRHRKSYFRKLSAGGQRRKETQDEFFSASFYHTAVTPLFTSSICLHADCLASQHDSDWEWCGRVCMCAGLKCISAFAVMEDS